MPTTKEKKRIKKLEKLLHECNLAVNEIYSRIDILGITNEEQHSIALNKNLAFLSSKFKGIDKLDKDSAKKIVDFFLKLGEEVYTDELLKRRDGNYVLSHLLFIHNYLAEKGSFNDLETRITALAHDFLEDIIDKSEKYKKYGTTDQDRIKMRDIGLDFLEGHLKELEFSPKEKKRIKGEVQALSRVRSQHYFDYLDTMLIFSLAEREFESSEEEEVDFIIRKETKSKEYREKGIKGSIFKYLREKEIDSSLYKLLEIKIADRIHNTLTLPEDKFSYKNRLFEVAKSMYLVHLGKMMVNMGFEKLSDQLPNISKEIKFKEMKGSSFQSFYQLYRFLKNKKEKTEEKKVKEGLDLLYRVSDAVIDLAAVSKTQTSKIKESLQSLFKRSKREVIDAEIGSVMKYNLINDIYKEAMSMKNDKQRPHLANSLDMLFSWYAPPKKGAIRDFKTDVKPWEGYAIARFLEVVIDRYLNDNSFYLEKLNQIEGRELWYDENARKLFPRKMIERSEYQRTRR